MRQIKIKENFDLNYSSQLLLVTVVSLGILNFTSCKKFIEVEVPRTSINGINVFADDATAAAVMTGVYTTMSTEVFSSGNGITPISFLSALSADELVLTSSALSNLEFFTNGLTKNNGGLWSSIYSYIFYANSTIEGLQAKEANALSPSVKQQLLGEAKFLRAFCYFYLVNLYGDAALVLSTDVKANRSLSRTFVSEIYQQIVEDLKDAKILLSSDYLDATLLQITADRLRPTKWAAAAMLARVYLYTNKYDSSEAEATFVINNTSVYDTVSLESVFLKNSKEAIWQLQPTGTTTQSNTKEGYLFIIPSTGPSNSNPVYLSNSLLNSFENDDQRKVNWVSNVKPTPPGTTTYYFPYKYKIGAVNTTTEEYSMVIRLAELYLIRAEARARQKNLTGAVADIDVIRKRAGLPLIAIINSGISQSALLDKILHERQIELFTEWGHRWLDLKRTGNVDAVMTNIAPEKGGSWETTDQFYPIPQGDIDRNLNLIQNPGY